MAYIGKSPSQAVRNKYSFTASGGETSISSSQISGFSFSDGTYLDVYLNGVLLVADSDYNTTTSNTIGGLTALSASDVVDIVVYDTFALFNGTFNNDVTFKGADYNATWTNSESALRFDDNAKVKFGTGGDLHIWHNGTASQILDNGTGALNIRGNLIKIQNVGNTESMASFTQDGAVDLYYDNVKTFETTSTGAKVTGSKLEITSTDSGSSEAPELSIFRDSSTPANLDETGVIIFNGKNSNNEKIQYARIDSRANSPTDGAEYGRFGIDVMTNGTSEIYYLASYDQNQFYKEIYLAPNKNIIFEGSGYTNFETTLTVENPTLSDKTITLPNATGTVMLNLVEDTTPQLGGVLDTNGNNIEFPDSSGAEVNRLKFGTGDDLHIFHNGINSVISDQGTGNLLIQGSQIEIKDAGNTETLAQFAQNGAVSLYHDNAKKLETTSTGISVTGNVAVSSGGGIDFSANSNQSGMTSELLDGYEEGTWTATLIGSTSNPSTAITTTAHYTKVGRLVYLACRIIGVDTTGAAGGIRITGNPFSIANGSVATGNVMLHKRFTASSTVNISPYVTTSYIGFYRAISNSVWAEISHSAGNDHYLIFTAVFHV
jgi:hypothetical protein